MRAIVLADTHIADGSNRALDERVISAVADADLVLHAGDVTGRALLERLGELAPVTAVLGNNDVELRGALPERIEVDLDGLSVALVHDSGARAGRPARLARWFPSADVVVYGHSHLPEDITTDDGLRLFNPGSPTQRRRAPTRTYGVLDVRDGRLLDLHHVHLD